MAPTRIRGVCGDYSAETVAQIDGHLIRLRAQLVGATVVRTNDVRRDIDRLLDRRRQLLPPVLIDFGDGENQIPTIV